jgi:putative ABC transport system ATP-binding protein
MIKTENLEKVYRTEEVQTKALNHVSLTVEKGEFVAIMGPSGCGKSTLQLLGTETSRYSERQRAELRKRSLGFVFQSFNLIDELTVFENVELPLRYLGVGAAERRQRVEQVLEKMQLLHRRNHFPLQLSGGQQQRVAVARAVVNAPPLLLADEPTGNLDSASGHDVLGLLTELNEAGTTVLMVTHSEHDARYARRVIRLLDGQVVLENSRSQF